MLGGGLKTRVRGIMGSGTVFIVPKDYVGPAHYCSHQSILSVPSPGGLSKELRKWHSHASSQVHFRFHVDPFMRSRAESVFTFHSIPVPFCFFSILFPVIVISMLDLLHAITTYWSYLCTRQLLAC